MSGGHDHVGAGLVGVLLQNPSWIEKVLVYERHQVFKNIPVPLHQKVPQSEQEGPCYFADQGLLW